MKKIDLETWEIIYILKSRVHFLNNIDSSSTPEETKDAIDRIQEALDTYKIAISEYQKEHQKK